MPLAVSTAFEASKQENVTITITITVTILAALPNYQIAITVIILETARDTLGGHVGHPSGATCWEDSKHQKYMKIT